MEHYIDDFVTMGARGTRECGENVAIMKEVFQEVNLPIDPEKDEGPAHRGTGDPPGSRKAPAIESHAISMAREESVQKEGTAITHWLSEPCMQSSAGSRSFLRQLIDLSSTVKHLSRCVRLGASTRSDTSFVWSGMGSL